MQQKMPWEEDWSQPQAAPMPGGGYPTITIPRDPRQVARENDASARAAVEQQLRLQAATRDAVRFSERNKPTLPAGYMMGPDGKTAVRIPGLPPEKGAEQPGQRDLDSVRAEALDKIRLARSLQQRSRDGWFATGFGASTMGSIGGTGAYDVRQDTETLKNAGALTRIMEMAKQNGGKNPLTPLSNSDFQALASSLSNLDTSQSDGQYQANVQRVIDLYTRAYQGAGGTDLEGDLDPAKRRRRSGPPVIGGGMPGSPPPPAGGQPTRSTTYYGDGGNGGGGAATLATGATKTERDPSLAGVNARVASMLRSGASDAAVRDYLAQVGARADPASVNAVFEFRRRNPGYKGGYSVNLENREVPTTGWERFAASPTGTGMYAALDAGLGGLTDEIASVAGGGDLADLNARKQLAFATNPKAAFTGQTLGTAASMYGLGALGRTAGITSRLANPQLAGDIAFGALSGAGQSNDNRLLGGTLGAAGGVAGNVIGNGVAGGVGALARTRPGMAVTNRARGMFGAPMLPTAQPLGAADNTILSAINRAGVDDVTGALSEAQGLNIPMSLADTNPNLRELAGAAVRRSPTASSFAEDALLPRARGQYDRFTSSVETNLGPTTNIPQRSAEMMGQARTAAADLYDRAYGNPVPSTPELDAVLGTPFGRQALGRARTIAANERRSPDELGFALDEQGNVALNPRPNDAIAQHLGARAEFEAAQDAYRAARQSPTANVDRARDRMLGARENLRIAEARLRAAPDPNSTASVPAYTTQTLDYVKRGMDDVLEEQRNPITGRLVLDEAGRAQNQVRGQLLDEVDRLNPDFAAARQAYAGPMASRDALSRGVDAYGLHPDELGMQVAGQSPEHLAQMQLGYRGTMVDHAGRVRDSGNPWDATLGSPVARDRLGAVYPNNPGVNRMLRQLDLERQLSQTTTAVLGNSRTARNQIADQAFASSPLIEGALHAGAAVATHGASVPGTAARLAGTGLKDRLALGLGKRAEAKADAIAPVLLNPDPNAAIAKALELLAQQRAWQDLVARTTPRRPLGMFGRAVGSQAAVVPLNR